MLALALPSPLEAYQAFIQLLFESIEKKPVMEIVFGWDRYALIGQGNKYDAFVSVHYLDLERTMRKGLHNPASCWRFGVIDYQAPTVGKPKIVEPLNWDNRYWSDMLMRECREYMADITRQLHKGPR